MNSIENFRQKEPTGFERVFSLQSDHLNRYLNERLTQRGLRELGEEMTGHTNPVVRYAGAWALADAAMYRHQFRASRASGISYDAKLQNAQYRDRLLDQAADVWASLDDPFREEIEAYRDNIKMVGSYLGLLLRARQATASLPSMRLVTRLFSGVEVSSSEIGLGLEGTTHQLAALGGEVLGYLTSNREINRVRSGLYGEISSIILMQNPEHVVVPASLRQDHHSRENQRADAMAVSTMRPFPRRYIQITAGDYGRDTPDRLVVHTKSDLVLSPELYVAHTMQALVDGESNAGVSAAVGARLQDISGALIERLSTPVSG